MSAFVERVFLTSPEHLAKQIFDHHKRDNDDALVLVARYGSKEQDLHAGE